jgi:hypothetical protein
MSVHKAFAAAFTEWERRYREEPERFQSEAEKLLKETPKTYGDACAPYFMTILDELSKGQPWNTIGQQA